MIVAYICLTTYWLTPVYYLLTAYVLNYLLLCITIY